MGGQRAGLSNILFIICRRFVSSLGRLHFTLPVGWLWQYSTKKDLEKLRTEDLKSLLTDLGKVEQAQSSFESLQLQNLKDLSERMMESK